MASRKSLPVRAVVRAVRALPPSKVTRRAGRAASVVLGTLGLPTVLDVPLEGGVVVEVDARGRTESAAVWTGRFEPDLQAFLQVAASVAGADVIDVGANVGLITIPWARAIAPTGGRVLALEPVPENMARLRRSVDRNHLSNVTSVECALGAEPGEVLITRESQFGEASGNAVIEVAGAERGATTHSVEVRTLDAVVAETGWRPGVIKIDCEGFDVQVIRGAKQVLASHRPIVFGEFHSELVPLFGPGVGSLAPLLIDLEYEMFAFVDRLVLEAAKPRDGIGDVALVPRELTVALSSAMQAAKD